jgi:hypothetical protein
MDNTMNNVEKYELPDGTYGTYEDWLEWDRD